jgi:hypothetical protein
VVVVADMLYELNRNYTTDFLKPKMF